MIVSDYTWSMVREGEQEPFWEQIYPFDISKSGFATGTRSSTWIILHGHSWVIYMRVLISIFAGKRLSPEDYTRSQAHWHGNTHIHINMYREADDSFYIVAYRNLYIEAETKWPIFCRRNLQMHFLQWKLFRIFEISLKFVPSFPINNISVADRRQAIIWSNDG